MASNAVQDITKEALTKMLEHIPNSRQGATTKLIIKDIVNGPEIGESLKEQAHNLIRRHTRASLLSAAKQLKLKIDNTTENVPLSLIIIHKVKSHLPEECGVCNDIYIVPLSESPHRRNNYCHACGQGSHDCSQEVDIFRAMADINHDYLKSARLRWLCSSCDVSLHWQNNSLQNKFKVFYTGDKTYAEAIKTTNITVTDQHGDNTSTNTNSFHGFTTFFIPSANNNNNNPSITTQPPSVLTSTPNQPIVSNRPLVNNQPVVNNQPAGNNPSTANNQPATSNPTPTGPSNNALQPNLKDVKKFPNLNKDKICTFLTKGKCRFGAKGENHLGKCDKYHPNQCRAYNLNGQTDNGCKEGLKCNEWHATYICRSSANSKTCSRPECPFKHHANCVVSRNDPFLNKPNQMPRKYQGPNFPIFNQRQPHQQQNQHYNNHFSNHRQQPYHQTFNQPPQIPQDQLVYMIRTIIREENNYQNHALM